MIHLSSNGDLNLDTGLDVDDDLLDDLSWCVKTIDVLVRLSYRLRATIRAWHGRRATYSMRRLWMRISKVSQVLEPSPQGVLRVVIFRVLVGRRTGPLTRRSLDLARSTSSVQTFSRASTLREVRVIRMRWIFWRIMR